MENAYRAGAIGYGDAKKRLLGKIDGHFAAARERRRELLARPSDVEDVLREGGRRAREVARATLDRCRAACGLGRPI
jgi:tryptophanyl-tRNA synthetase